MTFVLQPISATTISVASFVLIVVPVDAVRLDPDELAVTSSGALDTVPLNSSTVAAIAPDALAVTVT